jgi:hypothetical protein
MTGGIQLYGVSGEPTAATGIPPTPRTRGYVNIESFTLTERAHRGRREMILDRNVERL